MEFLELEVLFADFLLFLQRRYHSYFNCQLFCVIVKHNKVIVLKEVVLTVGGNVFLIYNAQFCLQLCLNVCLIFV